MSAEFTCDICNAPMELTKTIGTKQSGKSYRQRWFKCVICDYQKKVYACGMRDEELIPESTIRKAKKELDQLTKEPWKP